jgi:hypothetical protein
MKKLSTVLTLVLSLALSGQAVASSCYTEREFEAEQGLRIHSELMVIALTCIKMPRGGAEMYSKYQTFTNRNQRLITSYESDMIGYFRRQGVAQPEKQFHSLRTGLANHISKNAISMSTSSFCQRYGQNIDQAVVMDHAKVRRWAQMPVAQLPTKQPKCRA